MRSLRLLAFLLTSALLLSGCATTSGRINTTPVAPALLDCRDAPGVPADTNNSRKVAVYVVDLHDAYSDCKSKLGAVKKVLK
jgi:uncharacterized lipoprotein YajG